MKLIHTLVEGGQTWAHRVRMSKQVIKMALMLAILSAFAFFAYSFVRLDLVYVQSAYYCGKAELASSLLQTHITVSPQYWQRLTNENIRKDKVVPISTLKRLTKPYIKTLLSHLKILIFKSLRLSFIAFGSILLFFVLRGSVSKKRHHISGKKRVHSFLLRLLMILKRQASDLKIGSLPLVKGSETQHILITGGTGSGKTNCFHHILPQIREKHQKAVIIDTTGTYLEKYYDPSCDILLNPFDQRGTPWHPWAECESHFDYDNLSESIIPQSYHDQENYWRTAARTLLSALLSKLSKTQRTSELAQWILYEPLDKLAEFIQDTKAAAHIDTNSEKTAASIRSVAASFLSCIDYLTDTSTPFSIKNWIQNDSKKGWLFLNATPSQRSSLNPLLSCWFSVAIRSLIQMLPNRERRIWFIVDELPTLQKLKELDALVTESRKYGGCALLALQSPSQLEEIYGRASSQTITGNCATRIIFAEHDPEIAERISRSLGECEVREYQEGISYGAHEMRDGVNLSQQSKKIPVVSSTEIQLLENNTAYLKLPGNMPITKVKLKLR